jgi:hypothetical protein
MSAENITEVFLAIPTVQQQTLSFHLWKGKIRRKCGVMTGYKEATKLIEAEGSRIHQGNIRLLTRIVTPIDAAHDPAIQWSKEKQKKHAGTV